MGWIEALGRRILNRQLEEALWSSKATLPQSLHMQCNRGSSSGVAWRESFFMLRSWYSVCTWCHRCFLKSWWRSLCLSSSPLVPRHHVDCSMGLWTHAHSCTHLWMLAYIPSVCGGVVQSHTLCCPFCVLLHNCTVMYADWLLGQCLDGGSSCWCFFSTRNDLIALSCVESP